MADRRKLAERIRALLAKTVDNGCTEAEAIAAAELAKKLMDEYQLSLSDLELEQEGTRRGTTDKYKGGFDVPTRISMAIAAFCEVKVWKSRGGITYFGLTSDVEFAKWLTTALESFCWMQADSYQASKRMQGLTTDWTDRRSFVQGCAYRIYERLEEEVRKRVRRPQAGTGRDLVVVKNAIVEREFKKLGLNLRSSSRREANPSAGAYDAGRAAGDRASFGRPVHGGRAKMIGHG